MLILGIDPGIARVGWGFVEVQSSIRQLADKSQNYGCFETDKELSTAQRLKRIYDFLTELIAIHKPDVASVEELFFAANAKTASVVGEARGVILLCLVQNNLPISTYTPLQVKQSLTGYGRADKNQIQQMVKALLGLKTIPKPDDAADALAIALTHTMFSSKIEGYVNQPTRFKRKNYRYGT